MLVSWLAEIVGFSSSDTRLACEVPFIQGGTSTEKPAGQIDMVVARAVNGACSGTARKSRLFTSLAKGCNQNI